MKRMPIPNTGENILFLQNKRLYTSGDCDGNKH